MRQRALKDPLFKDVNLGSIPLSTTLLYIRMHYQKDTLKLSKTFYFDKELSAIIAFK